MNTRRGFCCIHAQLQVVTLATACIWLALLVPGWIWWELGRHALGIYLTVCTLRAARWVAGYSYRLSVVFIRHRRRRARRLPSAPVARLARPVVRCGIAPWATARSTSATVRGPSTP